MLIFIQIISAICIAACQNGGVCTEPATCKCPENYEGTRCEKEKEGSCPNEPEAQQAQVECKSNNCTISCEEGLAFPDGSTTMEMTCKDGEWASNNPDQSFPPNCQRKFFFKNIFFVHKISHVKLLKCLKKQFVNEIE